MEVLQARLLPYLPRDLAVYGRTFVSDGQYTQDGAWASAAVIAFALCTISYKVSRYYTPWYYKGYRNLSHLDQRDWDTRLANILFSFYIVYQAFYWLVVSDFFKSEEGGMRMFRKCHGIYTALGVSVGFFLIDLIVTLRYMMGGPAMVLHHVGSLTSVVAGCLSGQGHQLTLWMLSTEFTTPFISARYLLEKAGLKSHKIYLINGLFIMFSWTIARLATFPFFFYTVYLQRDQIPMLNPVSKGVLMTMPATLFILNTWWYTKIVRGALKALGVGASKVEGKAD